jgi:ABC-2 type transport system ATP-binding protein
LDVHESPREAHRIMGFLSDNFGLYGDLTVAQGLEYAARSQGLPASQVPAAVLATAQQLDLTQKLPQAAATLSRGQRQRLAIGQAIIHSPQVLLLDEPASGLDPEARSSLAQVFLALQARGMSLLVSSHILAELDEYSTHMLALHEGRVLEHRALRLSKTMDAPGAALQERFLHLEFASPIAALLPWLAAQPGVSVQEAQGQAVDITFTGTSGDQASLVAACVAAGHPLTVLAPVNENLQQSYLKSLQAGRLAGQRGEQSRTIA